MPKPLAGGRRPQVGRQFVGLAIRPSRSDLSAPFSRRPAARSKAGWLAGHPAEPWLLLATLGLTG